MDKKKAFIIGTGRCGTTLLAQMLNSHSRICVPHELQILFEISNNGPRLYEAFKEKKNEQFSADDFIKLIETRCPHKFHEYFDYRNFFEKQKYPIPSYKELVNQLYDEIAESRHKEIFIEQTPWYGQRIDILNESFPEAKYVHMVRDGRDVAISFSRTPWWHDDIGLNLERWHVEVRNIIDTSTAILKPNQLLQVRYEDLIEQPEVELKRVCDHLGVELEHEMLDAQTYIDYEVYGKESSNTISSSALKEWRKNRSTPTFKGSRYGWKSYQGFDFSMIPDHICQSLEALGYESCNPISFDVSSIQTRAQSIEQALIQAVTFHNAGKLLAAEKFYRAILQINPEHPKANHNLGTLYIQAQNPVASLPFFTSALEADPARGQYWLSYIDALNQAGQAEAAHEVLAMARQHGLSGDDVDALAASLRGERADAAGQPRSYCPVCGSDQVSFLPLPAFYLESARLHGFAHLGKGEMVSLEQYTCNRCGASDRERLYALWVDQELKKNGLSRSAKVMHFAPEEALSKKLRLLFADYQTADFGMGHVDFRVDIQNLPFADESYDFFICSHVLEHVENDDLAIMELYRITKTGGCGILVAPIAVGLNKTVEDPSVKDAAGRWRLYGQDDHVRLYAHDDYVNKIRRHGFRVAELGEDYFGANIFRSLGMIRTSILYVVSK